MSEGQKWDHLFSKDRLTPVFPVSDVEAASQYFCEKLGFTIQQAPGNGREWAVVSRGTSEIMLVPKDWPSGCSIRVDDVDEVCAELLSRYADFESGPTNQEYGRRDFLVRGPEGYEIGFWGPLKVEQEPASPPGETGDDNVPF
jgi:catechol 2,3-dioxygenase-like lactoylglutathione lyase family enzyme